MRAFNRAVASVAAATAVLLSGCTEVTEFPYAEQAFNAPAGTVPWFCNAAGNGTPLSGHGNGSHVHPEYEGRTKGRISAEDCTTFARQLDEVLSVVRPWDTRAEGEAAGWKVGAEYIAGLGTHHSRNGALAAFGATKFEHLNPQFLIYGGSGPDAPLVGVAYSLQGNVPLPEAFAGTNDWFHHHNKVCADFSAGVWPPPILAGAEEISDEACKAIKPGTVNFPLPNGGLSLLHLWINPPNEYRLDIFASGHNCLLATGLAAPADPCWEIAHRDPALGLPPGHGEHGHG
jgi:hypothetical protein